MGARYLPAVPGFAQNNKTKIICLRICGVYYSDTIVDTTVPPCTTGDYYQLLPIIIKPMKNEWIFHGQVFDVKDEVKINYYILKIYVQDQFNCICINIITLHLTHVLTLNFCNKTTWKICM